MDAARPLTGRADSRHGPLRRFLRSAAGATTFFLGLAVFMTWPLAASLTHNVPSDYGDPLYAAWAIAWVCHQLARAATGDFAAIAHFWDANQLFPEQGTLAFSDHFIGQAMTVAPIYWLTGNPILALSAAYLFAFTLSAVAVFLLVRELTNSPLAGYFAGVILPFNEYIFNFEVSHLQIASTGWMPLSLYLLRRYFTTRSRRRLLAAGAAIVMSNLSSGYYLLMFPPFVALYCIWEITGRRAWHDRRLLTELAVLTVGAALLTFPFVWPYYVARQRYGFTRSLSDITALAAAIDSYLASIRKLAPAYLLAAVAAVSGLLARLKRSESARSSMTGFFVVAAFAAFWLSLGPKPNWFGGSSFSLYAVMASFWPGMDAIRVSSRYAALFLIFLGVLAGLGSAWVERIAPLFGRLIVVGAGVTLIMANLRSPFPVNQELQPVYLRKPAAYLRPAPTPPSVYRYLSSLSKDLVVAELPFDDLWYNTRYLFFSTFHWRRMVNGFTSFYPPAAQDRQRWLINPLRTPEESWLTLRKAAATHVVLHTDAWDAATARALMEYFESRGSRSHGRFDGAVVYELPR